MESFVIYLGILSLFTGLYSLYASLRYRAYAMKMAKASEPSSRPSASATLFVPCCGEEEGLEANLESLLVQDYAGLRVCFIVESAADGAVGAIERVLARHPGRGERIVAGPARGKGQKVHNLLVAIAGAPPSDVWAFADSDGRPDPGWLARLVAALEGDGVGVASSYRFYVPEPASFASLLRSVWNASVLTLLGDHDHNFAWGGAMAIRREVFEKAGVASAWEGALSDDYALTRAIRSAGLRVEFVPSCLVGSFGHASLRELLAWCGRQIAITRVYQPGLFRVAAATQVLYTSFLVLGTVMAASGGIAAGALVALALCLSFTSGGIRARALSRIAPGFRRPIERHLWAYVGMVPLASFLTAMGVFRALASRRIAWRGKVYEMHSPTETSIVGQ